MKIAIAQPTYLPWLGYFDLMDQVDCFVILDSVQFEKQSWQQRNRIKTPSGLQWLTVPVIFRGRLGQRIQEVEIRTAEFAQKHLRAIELNYRRSPYFDLYFPQLLENLRTDESGCLTLVNLNLRLLEWLRGLLGIRTRMVRSSDLAEDGRRCELLVNLCRRLQADFYLSPLGSAGYLLADLGKDLGKFSDHGIVVAFHHYEHPQYRQLFMPFCPYASVLDLLFNEGDSAMEIIRSGRKPPLTPEQAAAASTVEEIRR